MTAQEERDFFWKCFDAYVVQQGNKFFVTHEKYGKNQAAGNINNTSPLASQTICCEYKYLEQTILVQVYILGNEKLFNALHFRKKEIEEKLGYEVEWVDHGKRSSNVKRIQKKFSINKPLKDMIEEVYPYVLDFIRVFSRYISLG